MEKKSLPHQKIVFVCCNQREEGERVCCASRDSQALRDRMKQLVKERGYRTRIRISQSGCMDRCEEGANVMIFPDNEWLSHVVLEDAEGLVDRIIGDLENEDSP
ncbi:MAG: (2Fe-2S) ferredoxin domain-containing protein [Candidatus Hydrogenedentota bacterium]